MTSDDVRAEDNQTEDVWLHAERFNTLSCESDKQQ